MRRLKELRGVEFVAIVLPGLAVLERPYTSLSEFSSFLERLRPSIPPGPQGTLANPSLTDEATRRILPALTPWQGGGVAFCAMPFAPEFLAVYTDLILPAATRAGFYVMRTDMEPDLRPIDRQIREGIEQAELIIGDVSGHNANVMYEVGIASAWAKPTLLLRSDREPLPFDLAQLQCFDYELLSPSSVRTALTERLRLWRESG